MKDVLLLSIAHKSGCSCLSITYLSLTLKTEITYEVTHTYRYLKTHTHCHGQIEHERVRANWNAFSHSRFCHFDVGTISACAINHWPTPHSETRYAAARDRVLSSYKLRELSSFILPRKCSTRPWQCRLCKREWSKRVSCIIAAVS